MGPFIFIYISSSNLSSPSGEKGSKNSSSKGFTIRRFQELQASGLWLALAKMLLSSTKKTDRGFSRRFVRPEKTLPLPHSLQIFLFFHVGLLVCRGRKMHTQNRKNMIWAAVDMFTCLKTAAQALCFLRVHGFCF